MRTIQIAVADVGYAASLSSLLLQNGAGEVVCVDVPDAGKEGVLVLDSRALERVARPLPHPECVVLIAPEHGLALDYAFAAGSKAVVSRRDPLDVGLLAVLAASLNASGWAG